MVKRVDTSKGRPWVAICMVALVVGLTSCGRGESTVDPSPGRPEESTTTPTTAPDDGEVETADPDSTTSTTSVVGVFPGEDDGDGDPSSTTVIIDQNSDNATEYTELAASGLVLTLEEQSCADDAVEAELDAGAERLDAVITAVQQCASPKAVDDFASVLLMAGGESLPPTEAACVAGNLRSDEEYRPFWAALFAEEPFDFLAAEVDVQNQYLDLFARCVSVGRALSEQTGAGLSPATIGCIDDLYADREFVRSTVEADLSADPDDVARVNDQIGSCLTPAERDAVGI